MTLERLQAETPQTDAAVLPRTKTGRIAFGEQCVPADFARTLERENAELRAELLRWKEFAEHQIHCAACGEHVSGCEEGTRLWNAAKGETLGERVGMEVAR